MTRIILASRSPRRRKILEMLGLTFDVVMPTVDEIDCSQNPTEMVRENALRKWRWCHERHPAAAIIAADTTVDLGGLCLGKPHTREEAFAMLRSSSGREQTVYTGYILSLPYEQEALSAVETSRVVFRELSDAMIDSYLLAVDPMDRAGAYDIDCHGDWIVSRYQGSLTNIMGLPKERVKEWIECKLGQ